MTNKVGTKIKELRESASISCDEFAERANITVEQLDAIENKDVKPSMAVLTRIVRVLGVRLGTLLDGSEAAGPVVVRSSTESTESVRLSDSSTLPNCHMNFSSLAEGKSDRHMEPFIIEISPDAVCAESRSHHEGEEFVYVLEGEVSIDYSGEKYVLSKGDSIYYDSIVPHRVFTASGTTARVLAVIYSPL